MQFQIFFKKEKILENSEEEEERTPSERKATCINHFHIVIIIIREFTVCFGNYDLGI